VFRYFLHELSDWPVAEACNAEPFGPDANGLYLVTLDAASPHCGVLEVALRELSIIEAREWTRSTFPEPDPFGEELPE
jgi:hypothetical protein